MVNGILHDEMVIITLSTQSKFNWR